MKASQIFCVAIVGAVLGGCSVGTNSSETISTEAKESKDPTFANIVLTDDETGRAPKTEFTTKTPKFIAYFELRNMAEGSKIRGVWYAEKADGIDPNFKIDEATLELKGGVTEGNFNLSKPNNDWPKGDYRLDFVYNEKVLDSIKFKVSD